MESYYYAGGKKVALEPDSEHVAVNQAAAEAAGLDMGDLSSPGGATRLGAGVVLAQRSGVNAQALARLKKAHALLPVFRKDRAILVALPEVRVEFDNPSQRKAVMAVLSGALDNLTIAEDEKDRLVLRSKSGDAAEALVAANEIFERAHPAASSVRFVQFVPRPEVSRS